jgi:O-antigen ligase
MVVAARPFAEPARGELATSPRWTIWGAAALLFVLAASNGAPVRTSSAFVVILLAPLIILERGPVVVLRAAEAPPNRSIFLALMIFAGANLLSTIVNPAAETAQALLLRCGLPLLVYCALTGLVLRRRDVNLLVLSLALGTAVICVRGLLAYHAEFGIPDFETILWSRFDKQRIQGYNEATLGNVGHMGAYFALVLPPLLLAAMRHIGGNAWRISLVAVVILGLMNLIISGSRTGLTLTLIAIVAIALSRASRRAIGATSVVALVVIATAPWWLDLVNDPEIVDRFAPSLGPKGFDESADERLYSITTGWQVFLANPIFGIGPDMSEQYNTLGVPHQSIVYQLSELGLPGGAAFIGLNIVIILAAARAAARAGGNGASAHRLLWLIGPAFWLIFGLMAGLSFNMSYALVWVGITHAMLALSGAVVLPQSR